jgi:hypothetical protein
MAQPAARDLPVVYGEYGEAPQTSDPSRLSVAGESIRTLLAADAPIHITYIPTPTPAHDDSGDYRVGPNRAKFETQDPAYLAETMQAIVSTTGGRYQPRGLTITSAPELNTGTACLDTRGGTNRARIVQHAKPYTTPGALEAIIIDQPDCEDVYVGANSADDTPILNPRSFAELGPVLMHELGHGANINHASTSICKDPVEPFDCKDSDELDDNTTLMSYAMDKRDAFSAPEMRQLGLLEPQEIIDNPRSGEFTLGDAQNTDPSVAKLLMANTIRVSWEPDTRASYDELCLPAEQVPPANRTVSGSADIDGQSVRYACTKTNPRMLDHTIQVRRDSGNGLKLITRKDRAPDPFKQQRSNGEVTPNTVIYQDDVRRITYLGVNDQNQARVSIQPV